MNLPNGLTVLRVVLVPVLLLALVAGGDLVAAAVFAAASLTDAADGHLARARDDETTFGKLMDPIADKLLIVAALIALVAMDRLALWIALVIVTRELVVTMTRMRATRDGVVIAAGAWGKAKTIVQVAAIFFVIALDPAPAWVDALVYAAVAITVASGVDYFLERRRRVGAARSGPQRPAASSQSRIDV